MTAYVSIDSNKQSYSLTKKNSKSLLRNVRSNQIQRSTSTRREGGTRALVGTPRDLSVHQPSARRFPFRPAREHSAADCRAVVCVCVFCRRVCLSVRLRPRPPAHGGRLDGFQHSTPTASTSNGKTTSRRGGGLAGNVSPERRGRCHRN